MSKEKIYQTVPPEAVIKNIRTLEEAEELADKAAIVSGYKVFYVYYERKQDWVAHCEDQDMRYDVTDSLRPDDQYMYATDPFLGLTNEKEN